AVAPFEVRAAEVGDSARAEVVEPLERLRSRPQHRPAEVRAAPLRREDVREEETLGDLETLLLGQGPLALGCDLLPRRDEPRGALGGSRDEGLISNLSPETRPQA